MLEINFKLGRADKSKIFSVGYKILKREQLIYWIHLKQQRFVGFFDKTLEDWEKYWKLQMIWNKLFSAQRIHVHFLLFSKS